MVIFYPSLSAQNAAAPFYDVTDFSQEVLGYWCERIFHPWRNFFNFVL